MTFTGCDNILDSTPAVTISEDLFWQTEDDAEKAIIGVYGPLMDEYYFAGHTEPVWDVQSDDLYRAGDWETMPSSKHSMLILNKENSSDVDGN